MIPELSKHVINDNKQKLCANVKPQRYQFIHFFCHEIKFKPLLTNQIKIYKTLKLKLNLNFM